MEKIDKKSIYHKTVYDEKSLTTVLEQAGFKNIRNWDWKTVFKNQDYDDQLPGIFSYG